MRKIYLFAAALAAIATVSSCTSDDEIVQAPEPTPAPEPAVVKECPFTFNVTVDNGTFKDSKSTRATALTGDALTNAFNGFSMIAVEELKSGNDVVSYKTYVGEEGVGAGKSATFAKKGTYWEYQGATWPSDNVGDYTPGNSFFYAISFAGEGGDASGVNSGNLTFNDNETTLVDPSSPDAVGFKYVMPLDDDGFYQLDKQEDVLVASNTGENTEGLTSGTVVDLTFSHAFANVEVKYIFPAQYDNWEESNQQFEGWQPSGKVNGSGHFMYVDYIALHGLKNAGVYNFKTKTWTPSGDGIIKKELTGKNRFITPTFYQDLIVDMTPYSYGDPDKKLRDKKRTYYHDLFTGDESLMIIPQSVTGMEFDTSSNLGDPLPSAWPGGYIEVHGYPVLNLDENARTNSTGRTFTADEINLIVSERLENGDENGDWIVQGSSTSVSDPNGINGELYSVYIPFTITFDGNKKYVLYIDLSNVKENTGEGYFEGATTSRFINPLED